MMPSTKPPEISRSTGKATSPARALSRGRELLARVAAHLQGVGELTPAPQPANGAAPPEMDGWPRLHAATLRAIRATDSGAMLAEILRGLTAAFGASAGAVFLRVRGEAGLALEAAVGFAPEFEDVARRLPEKTGAWGACLAEGGPVAVEDAAQDPRFAGAAALVRAGRFRACFCAPLLDPQGAAIGVLAVHFGGARAATERETQFLALWAETTAGLLLRRREETALRGSEERFRALAEHSPMIVWVIERDGTCSYLNARWREFTGESETSGLGQAWLERVHPEDRGALLGRFASAAERRESLRSEYRLLRRDGVYRWMLDAAIPRYDAGGEFQGYTGSVMDITERREAETIVRESAQRLSLAMAVADLGDWSWDAATDRVTFSDRIAAMIGVPTSSPLKGREADRLLHDDDREHILQSVARAIETRGDFDVECRVRAPAGEWVWVAMRGRAVYQPGGAMQGLRGVVQDISIRKRAEQKLRAQEAQLRFVSTNAPVVLSHWSRENRLLFASRDFAERWQTSPEALLGRTVAEVLGEAAWETVKPYVSRVLTGEPVSFEQEIPYGGLGRRYMRVSYTPELGEDGRVRGYFSVVSDLTDRQRAELALRQSEERLRLATQTGKVGLWDWDVTANRITWTDSLYEIHGVTPETFNATVEGFASLVHPDDAAPVAREIQRCLETGERYEIEFRAVRPDGEVIWVYTNAVVLRDGGRPVRMLGGTLDITARKRTELALRESEERFRTLARHAPVGIFMTNERGDCVFVNESWWAMTGRSAEEAAGPGWMEALHPDDRARVVAEWQLAVKEQRKFALEYRFLRRDGRVTWVHGSAVLFRNSHGSTGHIGTVADITERKTAEFALRESEKRFRTLANRAPVGIFMTNPAGDTVFVNETWSTMSGLKPEQAQGNGWLQAVHPDDRARIVDGWNEAVSAGTSSLAEYRFLRADGSVAWVQGNAVQLRDPNGRPGGYVGTIADFTQRKEAELALRANEARYRQLIEMLPVAVYTCDAEGRVDLFNDAAVAMWGRTPVAGVDRWSGAHRVFHPDGAPLDLERGAVAAAVREGRGFSRVEAIFERPDGERRHVLAFPHPLRDGAGRVAGVVNALIDITEHKQAEANAAFLNGLSQELAALDGADEIMRHATRAVGHYFRVDRCYFFEATSDPARVNVGLDWQRDGLPSVAGIYQVGNFGRSKWWRAIESGPLAIADTRRHPLTAEIHPSYAALEICGYATASVRREGRWAAALAMSTRTPRAWREDETALLGNVATLVWPMVERARAEAALQAHAQELEHKVEQRTVSLREAIAQMEEFSYSVSHDLRSPLRAMNAYAEALLEDHAGQLDETARSYLERIRRSSVRMEKLTHDVLTYSRIAREEQRLAPVAVDRLVRDLIDQYAELQPAAADVTVEAPHPVLAHESSLGQCLGNLLTNAAKFVRPGERPRIVVRTTASGERVRISVRDEGIGIPPQYHAALFQVFERVPTRARYEGTGIGLAIVRKAAEKMGGTCGVESDGGTGSTFWVELAKA